MSGENWPLLNAQRKKMFGLIECVKSKWANPQEKSEMSGKSKVFVAQKVSDIARAPCDLSVHFCHFPRNI